MKNYLLLIILCLFSITFVSGQEVVYEGRLTDYDSSDDLSGVTISAVANGSVVYSTTTGRRGKYTVQLPIGAVYTVKYEKNGYVTKMMRVDVTSVNEEDIPIGGRIMPPVDIDLFKERENVDFSFLEEEPVVEWDYDDKKFVMDWDRQVYNRMKKKIEDKLAEAEEKKEEADAKYNKLISEADDLFKDEDYEGALAKYEEAIGIEGKEMEEHPNNRILEIEELLQEQAEKELAEKQENQEYQNLIDAADNLAENEDYDSAIAKYQEAISLKPEEQYPKDQIEAMNAAKEKAAKMEEYTELIDRADGFFDQNSLKAARDIYQQAAELLPSEQYPKDQIAKIEEKLEEQEELREQKEKYEEAVAKADEFYDAQEYDQAIAKYEEALEYESAATYPKERIELAKEKLAEQQVEQEKKEQFDALVKEADEMVVAGDYEDAVNKYDEAIAIIDNEEVQEKKKKAQNLLEEAAEEAESEARIEELLTSANENMSNEAYEDALEDYQEVLSLDENNTQAIEGKTAAEKAIAEQQEKAEQKEAFDELVAEGDKAFEAEEWENAKMKYEGAKDIIDDDQHINDRLEAIQTKISEAKQQEQVNEQIQALLDQAADLKNDNAWKQVVDKYDEALALDDSRDDVRQLLEEAKQSLKEWQEQQSEQEQFETLKTEGDQLFAQEKWEDAQEKYNEALAIQEDEEIDQKLLTIEEKLSELASEKELEEQFNDLVEEAEQLEEDEALQDAINKYQEALELKSSADVENEIARLEDELAAQEDQAKKQEQYEEAMANGKEAMDEEDYAGAVKFFEDALLAIPMDDEATRLKNEAEDALDDLRSEEEKYNALLADAKSAFDNEKLEEAKALYEEAQAMRPKATLPQDKIIEIDELLRKREEEQAEQNESEQKEQEYQNKLELAEVAAGNFKYEKAIEHLESALEIKPEENFPKKKIKEYQALLDQIAAQDAKEKKYNNFIDQADQAFDNASYEESIGFYEEALGVKPKEEYPAQQLLKAEELLKSNEDKEKNRVYNDLIAKGDEYFTDESYEDALAKYQEALEEKPGDQYAADKIEETQQIIDNKAKEEAENSESLIKYNEAIAEADDLFQQEDYIRAKEKYEEALSFKPNDTYAIEKVQESVQKAKSKVEDKDNALYQKIISKADEYFDEENWEKATSLYKRALKLRSYDQYPKDKLEEIKAIKNGNVKKKKELEYLGEKENISIIEGQALLEQAENQREQLKQERVQNRIEQNEGQADDRKVVDDEERVIYENEILRINELRNELARVERDDKDDIVVRVDEQEYNFEQLTIQENTFERGEVLRENQNLTYISDDYKEQIKSKSQQVDDKVEDVKEIEVAREELDRAERTEERSGVMSTNDQLTDVAEDQRNEVQRSVEMRKENEFKVDQLQQDQERRVQNESAEEYEKIKRMESDALLAELSKAEKEQEKQVIHDQLKEDIKALEGNLQEKNRGETRELYEEQLTADADLVAAQEQYKESQEGNDDAREMAVEQLKDVEEDHERELRGRSDKEVEENQDNVEYTESIEEKKREGLVKHKGEKVELNEKVKDREIRYEREEKMKADTEERNREVASDNIERINVNDEQIRKEKSEKVKENDEQVKAVESNIEAGERVRKEALNEDKLKAQDLLDKIETGKIKMTPEIANSLGDEFPEGVSQETYIRRDKDGIPVKVVTRRIVVTNGHGEVFMRIQTRNGVTYSKNNRPISEAAWIRGTEDADLVQHF